MTHTADLVHTWLSFGSKSTTRNQCHVSLQCADARCTIAYFTETHFQYVCCLSVKHRCRAATPRQVSTYLKLLDAQRQSVSAEVNVSVCLSRVQDEGLACYLAIKLLPRHSVALQSGRNLAANCNVCCTFQLKVKTRMAPGRPATPKADLTCLHGPVTRNL